ncbi:hypothetical protein Rhow_002377 [Rhodococcus wratislaviensis]|uniref:Uncharacterized protein n=1 Tax=Rhodococcus wratislaviensis TaxID=44752 RepID=A0A402C5I6_RHOWR|nr:hypothetical protein Rhow_002377 [Rhodococcus wratislaviensis]
MPRNRGQLNYNCIDVRLRLHRPKCWWEQTTATPTPLF